MPGVAIANFASPSSSTRLFSKSSAQSCAPSNPSSSRSLNSNVISLRPSNASKLSNCRRNFASSFCSFFSSLCSLTSLLLSLDEAADEEDEADADADALATGAAGSIGANPVGDGAIFTLRVMVARAFCDGAGTGAAIGAGSTVSPSEITSKCR